MRTHVKWLLATAVALAVLVPTLAIAAGEGNPLRGGVRNPSSNESVALSRETEIIANTSTYGTRQSNKSANGGGAVYGCRSAQGGSAAGNEPCVRAVNLSNGRAFEFESTAEEAGRIEVGGGGDTVRPFSTNATGTATGLNADEVDGFDSAQLAPRFARVAADGALLGNRGARSSARTSEGTYQVDFNAPSIEACVFSGTQLQHDNNNGAVAVEVADADTLRVRTRNGGGSDGTGPTDPEDKPFNVIVYC
jgi:hypothetical protein